MAWLDKKCSESELWKMNWKIEASLVYFPLYVSLSVSEERCINEHKIDSIDKCMEIVHF